LLRLNIISSYFCLDLPDGIGIGTEGVGLGQSFVSFDTVEGVSSILILWLI